MKQIINLIHNDDGDLIDFQVPYEIAIANLRLSSTFSISSDDSKDGSVASVSKIALIDHLLSF